jgi:hypothetical protein
MPAPRFPAILATIAAAYLAASTGCAKSDEIAPPGGSASGSGGDETGPGSGGSGPSTTTAGQGGDAASSTSGGDGGAGPASTASGPGSSGSGGDGGASSSSGATCGDGAISDDEDCDGADLGSATCASEGFASGTLACDGDCAFDTSGCSEVAACANGLDDDDDGLIDEDDPGCTSDDDDDELVHAPTCDGAGTPVVDLTSVQGLAVTFEGTTDEAGVIVNNFTSTAGGACPSAPGPEVAFRFVVSETIATLVISLDNPGTETDWDPVLYVRSATCTGAQVGCNDDGGGGLASVLVLSNVQPGTYYIFVDGATAADVGDFELTLNPS